MVAAVVLTGAMMVMTVALMALCGRASVAMKLSGTMIVVVIATPAVLGAAQIAVHGRSVSQRRALAETLTG